LVELAVTLPFLLFLLLGIVEVGHALNSYLTIVAAARDGARLGSQGAADASTIRNLVANETARLKDNPTTLTCGPGTGICVQGVPGGTPSTLVLPETNRRSLRVRVCYDHALIVGFPGLDDPIRMCSETVMRVVH
jgi:Flp pilus assembly protein TadG